MVFQQVIPFRLLEITLNTCKCKTRKGTSPIKSGSEKEDVEQPSPFGFEKQADSLSDSQMIIKDKRVRLLVLW